MVEEGGPLEDHCSVTKVCCPGLWATGVKGRESLQSKDFGPQ